MGLFKSKYEKELDARLESIRMNLSNNYKDAAQMDLAELEQLLAGYAAEGKLNEKTQTFYEGQLSAYKGRLKGFTHNDQKPYWT